MMYAFYHGKIVDTYFAEYNVLIAFCNKFFYGVEFVRLKRRNFFYHFDLIQFYCLVQNHVKTKITYEI